MTAKHSKSIKAGKQAIAKLAELKKIAAEGGLLATPKEGTGPWFVPSNNPAKLEKQNPLIGLSIEETMNRVNSVVALVRDAAQCESPLDDTKEGIELVLALVKDAIELQSEYFSKHGRQIPEKKEERHG